MLMKILELINQKEFKIMAPGEDIIPLKDLIPSEPTFRELYDAVGHDPDLPLDVSREEIAYAVARAINLHSFCVVYVVPEESDFSKIDAYAWITTAPHRRIQEIKL
jgi:hypothetical protein